MELTKENKDWIKQSIIDHAYLDVDKVEDTDDLTETIGMDSLDKVEFTMGIEKQFGITINDHEHDDLKTVEDVYKFLESK